MINKSESGWFSEQWLRVGAKRDIVEWLRRESWNRYGCPIGEVIDQIIRPVMEENNNDVFQGHVDRHYARVSTRKRNQK